VYVDFVKQCGMKPMIALSIEHYESLLKGATEASPVYFRMKNAVKMANTIIVRCDLDEAEMFLQVAKQFCPDVVPQIENEMRVARSSG
jgi:hypothetical protein